MKSGGNPSLFPHIWNQLQILLPFPKEFIFQKKRLAVCRDWTTGPFVFEREECIGEKGFLKTVQKTRSGRGY